MVRHIISSRIFNGFSINRKRIKQTKNKQQKAVKSKQQDLNQLASNYVDASQKLRSSQLQEIVCNTAVAKAV